MSAEKGHHNSDSLFFSAGGEAEERKIHGRQVSAAPVEHMRDQTLINERAVQCCPPPPSTVASNSYRN